MTRKKKSITVMTTTNEMYLPTRLVYEVYDSAQLRAKLQKLTCFSWNPQKKGWTWEYYGEVLKMAFPPEYKKDEFQPTVLATCYLVDDKTFHVYTRCALRTVRFLSFFDKQVPRSIAMGMFIDGYNLLTTVDPGDPVPPPEQYFSDESKVEFDDVVALMDLPDSPAKKAALLDYFARVPQRTLRPLERHRLEGFYADGPKLMEQTARFREVLAGLQHQSNKPIRPHEVIANLLANQR